MFSVLSSLSVSLVSRVLSPWYCRPGGPHGQNKTPGERLKVLAARRAHTGMPPTARPWGGRLPGRRRGVCLGASWKYFWRLLGASRVASGGLLGASCKLPGGSWGHAGSHTLQENTPQPFLAISWGPLGAPWGPSWGSLGQSGAPIGPSWRPLGQYWPSWSSLERLLGRRVRCEDAHSEYTKNIRFPKGMGRASWGAH